MRCLDRDLDVSGVVDVGVFVFLWWLDGDWQIGVIFVFVGATVVFFWKDSVRSWKRWMLPMTDSRHWIFYNRLYRWSHRCLVIYKKITFRGFPRGDFLDSKQVDLKSSECKMSECGTSDVRWPNQRVVPEKRPMPSRRVKLLSHWRTKSISAAVIFHSFGSFVSNSVSSDMSFRKYLECRHIFHYFSMISLFRLRLAVGLAWWFGCSL